MLARPQRNSNTNVAQLGFRRRNLTQLNKIAAAAVPKLKNKKRFSDLLKCILMYL